MRCFTHISKLIRTKRLMHPKRYSQSELSTSLGYKNGQFISNVERGLCSIPLKMLTKVSGVLDIEVSELKDVMLADFGQTIDNFLASQQSAVNQSVNVGLEQVEVASSTVEIEPATDVIGEMAH